MDLSDVELPPLPHHELIDEELHLSIWRIECWQGDPENAAPEEHDAIGWFSLRNALALRLAHPDYPALLTRFAARSTAG